MHPIVILGSGLAGITLLRELRKLDKTTAVTVVTADDGAFYSKPNLSNALMLNKTAAQLALSSSADLATQLNATLLTHTEVRAIHTEYSQLETSAGTLIYSQLVLAVGAHPIRLPLQGDAAAEVLSVNNLADYARFRQHVAGKQRVAILGAGLIGCEFANDWQAAGINSTVFDLAPQALGRLLPAQAAAFLRNRLEAAGIQFHLQTSLTSVDKKGAGYLLTDNHGTQHEVDLLLSAIGLKPATELAATAGLKINRGIVVDQQLRTSVANIYALGDCAEVQGLVLPFVQPIMHAARALAATLSGHPTALRYPAMPVVVKTPACPTVVCPPPQGVNGTWEERIEGDSVRAIFKDENGTAHGFALLGETAVKERTALTAQMPDWLG
jgi:rubredoxin-NAD+ reductase